MIIVVWVLIAVGIDSYRLKWHISAPEILEQSSIWIRASRQRKDGAGLEEPLEFSIGRVERKRAPSSDSQLTPRQLLNLIGDIRRLYAVSRSLTHVIARDRRLGEPGTRMTVGRLSDSLVAARR